MKRDIREAAATVLELDRDDIQPNPVVRQMTPQKAKKTKEHLSLSHDTTGATGDVKMERESSPESNSDSSFQLRLQQ